MRTLTRSLIAAVPAATLVLLAPATTAAAGTPERQAACAALGGTFTGGNNPQSQRPAVRGG